MIIWMTQIAQAGKYVQLTNPAAHPRICMLSFTALSHTVDAL